jgi:hypothetical protein
MLIGLEGAYVFYVSTISSQSLSVTFVLKASEAERDLGNADIEGAPCHFYLDRLRRSVIR